MEIKSVIIDKNYKPYGFEAKEGTITKLEDFMENPPKSSQIAILNEKFIEINGFKFKNLEMKQLKNKKLETISNELTLKERLILKDALKGFKVFFNGQYIELTLRELYDLSKYCNCSNFVLKANKNNIFICGKGIKIKDLPAKEFLKEGEKIKNKSTVNKAELAANEKEFDILDILEYLKTLNALIFKLPTEEYLKSKNTSKKTSNEFIPLGIGEISSPKVRYNEKNINVNSTFKKYGNVLVNFNGNEFTIPTYVLTTKHIFSNGINYLTKFGVILDESKEKEFYSKFIGTFGLEKIDNDLITTPLKSIINKKDICMYTLDTSKIEFVKENKLDSFLLSQSKIKELSMNLIYLKTQKRYLNSIKKETISILNTKGIAIPRAKSGIYNSFNDEMLNYLRDEIGIDIYTGMFTKTEDNTELIEEPEEIEISYYIKGLKTIPSSKDIIDKNKKALKFFNDELDEIMKDLSSKKSITDKYKKIDSYIESINEKIEYITQSLWRHKLASYKKGRKKFFVEKDTFELIKETEKYKEYQCNIKEAEDLILRLSNIDLKEIES